ncbi:hypothetical protein [Paracoccus sp. SSJ]|uniref:hypothetical protein n=1 Tax=Paracoccus sp. SSJ TaxID=3050636 RepID=UPI00254B27D3|nr:hypothetical protein [Paracoccus sp. SSJ]MDK8871609.1 hypothetical protein [Paracoccus sp. SSJ]
MSDFPKSTNYRATTALACEIAATHPDRFNEAVHAGFYPCAPKTTPGKARSFDVNDIIVLRLYQRFLDAGMKAESAGHKACAIRQFLETHPEADQVYIVKPSMGSSYYVDQFDPKERHIPWEGPHAPDVLSVEVWNFHYLRGRIVHEIEEAAKVVGG